MDAAGDGGLGRSLRGEEDGRPVSEGAGMNKCLPLLYLMEFMQSHLFTNGACACVGSV